MRGLPVLAILNITGALSKLDCKTPVICDPSLESDIFLGAAHFANEDACQTSCSIGHPSNPCKFFTFVPNAQDQVPNCYKMTQCNEMSVPFAGAKSGAWSCDDPEIFCGAIGPIPEYNSRKTTWTCDHNVHPYGDESKRIFQDTTCRTSCSSFKSGGSRADIVVSSRCVAADDGVSSVWSSASPGGITDSAGDTILSASTNPTPACGCEDLVITGTIQEEVGKVFQCERDPEVNADGNTVITDDNPCFLSCDGFQVWDLYCAMGEWSMDLQSASDVFCHGGGEETTTNKYTEISTFWPTAP